MIYVTDFLRLPQGTDTHSVPKKQKSTEVLLPVNMLLTISIPKEHKLSFKPVYFIHEICNVQISSEDRSVSYFFIPVFRAKVLNLQIYLKVILKPAFITYTISKYQNLVKLTIKKKES